MKLRIVLNEELEKSFGAMNGFAARCGIRCRHMNPQDVLYSKLITAGDPR